MRDVRRRLEKLEVNAFKHHLTSYLFPGLTVEQLVAEMIQFLELPLDARQARMPQFTEAEHAEMPSWLPLYRRMRMLL